MFLNKQLSSSQILPVHAQVWSVRSGPQGDTYWFPLHHTYQDEELTEEVPPQEESQCLVHQLAQLRHLLNQRQTQPSRTGKTYTGLLRVYWSCNSSFNLTVNLSWTGWIHIFKLKFLPFVLNGSRFSFPPKKFLNKQEHRSFIEQSTSADPSWLIVDYMTYCNLVPQKRRLYFTNL